MMNVKVIIYDGVKYETTSKKCKSVEYENIRSLRVEHIENDEIYKMGFDETDEYQEYMIIIYADGDESYFRNSHCDAFRI